MPRKFRNIMGETRWVHVGGRLREVKAGGVIETDDDHDWQPHQWELVSSSKPKTPGSVKDDSVEGSK